MKIDIDLRRLRFFVEVVKQGGFSQAAKAVFTTQSTVSKAVKQLETELGVPLFERLGHRSLLTAAGQIVYRRAINLLIDGDDMLAELDELQGLKRGTLHVGFPRVGSSALFAPVFASFRRRYSGIEVKMSVQGGKRLEEMLRDGELDIAALVHPIPADFASQDVCVDALVALMPSDHDLASLETVSLTRLGMFPFILIDDGFAVNEQILDACAKRGIVPKIATRSGQIDFIFELVAVGVGIAFLPQVLAERRPHPMVRCVPLDEPLCEWRIALAWRRDGCLSHAARAWLAQAVEAHDNIQSSWPEHSDHPTHAALSLVVVNR